MFTTHSFIHDSQTHQGIQHIASLIGEKIRGSYRMDEHDENIWCYGRNRLRTEQKQWGEIAISTCEKCLENLSNGITPQLNLNTYLPTPDMLDYVLAILKATGKLDQAGTRTMQVENCVGTWVNRRYGGVARWRSLIIDTHKMEYSTEKLSRNTLQACNKTCVEFTLHMLHACLPINKSLKSSKPMIHHGHDQRRGLPATSP